MHLDSFPLDCKAYVGNLENNGEKTALEQAFGYYGPLPSVWIDQSYPPALLSLSLRIPERQRMLSTSKMEEHCVAAVLERNCQMVENGC